MKAELVEQAAKIIPEPQMLINVVSRRVAQLNNGRAPLVPTTPHMGNANIALTEIVEGKLRNPTVSRKTASKKHVPLIAVPARISARNIPSSTRPPALPARGLFIPLLQS